MILERISRKNRRKAMMRNRRNDSNIESEIEREIREGIDR